MTSYLHKTLRQVLGKWVVFRDVEGKTRSGKVIIKTPDNDCVVVREGERVRVVHLLDIVDAF